MNHDLVIKANVTFQVTKVLTLRMVLFLGLWGRASMPHILVTPNYWRSAPKRVASHSMWTFMDMHPRGAALYMAIIMRMKIHR